MAQEDPWELQYTNRHYPEGLLIKGKAFWPKILQYYDVCHVFFPKSQRWNYLCFILQNKTSISDRRHNFFKITAKLKFTVDCNTVLVLRYLVSNRSMCGSWNSFMKILQVSSYLKILQVWYMKLMVWRSDDLVRWINVHKEDALHPG